MANVLPGYLSARRWFGDKTKRIVRVTISDLIDIGTPKGELVFAITSCKFTDRTQSSYLIPLAIMEPDSPDPILTLPGGRRAVEGLADPAFRLALIKSLAAGVIISGTQGRLVFRPESSGGGELALAAGLPHRILAVEQSNTAIVYGSDVIVKVFRKLQSGINPDVELSRFLTGKTGFKSVSRFYGSIVYELDGVETSVGIAQRFVQNVGDGWAFILRHLREIAESHGDRTPPETSRAIAARLGEVTAQ